MSKSTIVIILTIVLLAVISIPLFEWKEIDDHKGNTWMDLDNKKNSGLWLFLQLLKDTKGENNVAVVDKLKDLEYDSLKSNLTIIYSYNSSYDNGVLDTFLAKHPSTDVLLFNSPYKWYEDSIFSLRISQTTLAIDSNSFTLYPLDREGMYLDSMELTMYAYDSVKYWVNIIDRELEIPYFIEFNPNEDFIITKYDEIIFGKYPDSTRSIYYHTLPTLFINEYLATPTGKKHFEYVISELDYDKYTLLELPSYQYDAPDFEKNYFQFIFNNKGMKMAYLIFLVSLILAFIFKGKRKQKVVPLIKEKKNTSIEFIQILADLHQSQDSPIKLVRKMEKIFYYQMNQKYYIPEKTENYAEKLATKSEIPLNKIKFVLAWFEKAKTMSYVNDQDISSISYELEKIFNHQKNYRDGRPI